ncbi:hypothetical protein Vqi01_27130 [Micromonospora qiuiae]|uniref:Secreted protein n=2 Tax=Micromonospora qiuiae TaxID=502268 RepID=A0ABQ4JBJ7_9ACTN|nr:hypothetical protein Vqi01_27130 [Micromonospora qiuiae]
MHISPITYVLIFIGFFAALVAFAAVSARREQRKGWIHIPKPPRTSEERRHDIDVDRPRASEERGRQDVNDDPDDPDDPYDASGPLTGF